MFYPPTISAAPRLEVSGHMLTELVQDPRPGPGSSPRVSCCPPSARVTRTRPASSPGSWWRPLTTTGTDSPWSTLTWTGTRPVLTIFSGPVPTPFIMMCLIGNSRKRDNRDWKLKLSILGIGHRGFAYFNLKLNFVLAFKTRIQTCNY